MGLESGIPTLMDLDDLAEAWGVSGTRLVRLCRAIGIRPIEAKESDPQSNLPVNYTLLRI